MLPDVFGQMMLQATRYALGRRTTAPSDTSSAIVCAWRAIPPYWQDLIERDLRDEIQRAEQRGEYVGDECDYRTWTNLLDWIGELRGLTSRGRS